MRELNKLMKNSKKRLESLPSKYAKNVVSTRQVNSNISRTITVCDYTEKEIVEETDTYIKYRMKPMGTVDMAQAMQLMKNTLHGAFSSNSVPDNCIILKGGVLECRDSLTQTISLSNQTGG